MKISSLQSEQNQEDDSSEQKNLDEDNERNLSMGEDCCEGGARRRNSAASCEDDSIYGKQQNQGRRGGEEELPSSTQSCFQSRQFKCMFFTTIVVTMALTVGKSYVYDEDNSRRTRGAVGVDAFGRKIDEFGNVVYVSGRRRNLLFLNEYGDDNNNGYPNWIVNEYGWMLYFLAIAFVLLGLKVVSGEQFLKKAFDAVAIDLSFLPRKNGSKWIFDGAFNGPKEYEVDVERYEEEQKLSHEKANSFSRVSIVLFFLVLFSFLNPSSPGCYLGVSSVFGVCLYNLTIVPAIMLWRKESLSLQRQRQANAQKSFLLWSTETMTSYDYTHLRRDFLFHLASLLLISAYCARTIDVESINADNIVSSANDDDEESTTMTTTTKLMLTKHVYSLGWRMGLWVVQLYFAYVCFRRCWVFFGRKKIHRRKEKEEKRELKKKKKKEKIELRSLSSLSPSSQSPSQVGDDVETTPPRIMSTSLEPPPPILFEPAYDDVMTDLDEELKINEANVESADEAEIKFASDNDDNNNNDDDGEIKEIEEEEEEEEEDSAERDAEEEANVGVQEICMFECADEGDKEQQEQQYHQFVGHERAQTNPKRSSFVELSFLKRQTLKIERVLSKPWVFIFNLTIPSCPSARKVSTNDADDGDNNNDNDSDDYDNTDSDWLSDSSDGGNADDIAVKIERRKCRARCYTIFCGILWLAVLSYAMVEFATHLCNIFVQSSFLSKYDITNDDGSFESFIGGVVLAFVISQCMNVHDTYFLQHSAEQMEANVETGNDSIFRVVLFDQLVTFGFPIVLILPWYKNGDYNMDIPRNRTINVLFFASIAASTLYYAFARISMGKVNTPYRTNKGNATLEQSVATMFIAAYVVAIAMITCVSFDLIF